jgi:hypothetical protein
MTDGMAVMSLSAAMDHVCQIMLNGKLLHKFEKWCKFLSRVKVKSGKKKSHKMRPACTVTFGLRSIVQTAEFSPVTEGPNISKASCNKNYEPQYDRNNFHVRTVHLDIIKVLFFHQLMH